MKKHFFRYRVVNVTTLFFIAVWGLGMVPNTASNRYSRENITADTGNVAAVTDADLVNPWGIAQSPAGHWFIALNSRGSVKAYTGKGAPYPARDPFVIAVPAPPETAEMPSTPTGIVFNSTSDFIIGEGRPALLIIATEDGCLSGWNPEVNEDKAVLAVDNSSVAMYKGVTIGRMHGKRHIYAANFLTGDIDVFDTYFHQVPLPTGAFVDAELPEGFAPYNIQVIDERIYVAYALQDSDKAGALPGAGFGFVTVFDGSGRLLTRLKSGPELNAPWGMTLAPAEFGRFGGMLLVGNTGDGTIAAYDRFTGEFKGLLEGVKGDLIMIQELRGIAAGNNAATGPAAALYFCAAFETEEHGLFGLLKPGL